MPYLVASIGLTVCWWDLPALIILVAVVTVSGIKLHKAKVEERELEEQLERIYEDKTIEVNTGL